MYTNNTGIPLSLALWLATDEYEHDPNAISATGLLKPIRSIVLSLRAKEDKESRDQDIVTRIASRFGTAVHDSVEKAWKASKTAEFLLELGTPQQIIDRMVINPKTGSLAKDDIPIYLEVRTKKKLDNFYITGQFDFVMEGMVEDFKTTGVYNYIKGSNITKYIKQGSIYRWLNPTIITESQMRINYIFTDWSKRDSMRNKDYPQNKIVSSTYTLMSISETEAFIRDVLNKITHYKDRPQSDMPRCTPEELWQNPTKYKYYKNPDAKRATKIYDSKLEATQRATTDGGIVKVFQDPAKACLYCDAINICDQARGLKNQGLL